MRPNPTLGVPQCAAGISSLLSPRQFCSAAVVVLVSQPKATNPDGGPGTGGTQSLRRRAARHPDDRGRQSHAMCGNGVHGSGERATTATRRRATAAARSARSPRAGPARARRASATWRASAATASSARREACDDMNTTAGDGCSADCKKVETGYECRVPGRRCVPACGDGKIIGGEACDDGNTTPDDGCSPTCAVEPGATCDRHADAQQVRRGGVRQQEGRGRRVVRRG